LTVTSSHTVNILGVPVGVYTMDTLLARFAALIAAPGCAVAHGVNAQVINLTFSDPEFLEGLHRADLLYADGASLILASRFLGGHLPEKLTTTDLWPPLCEMAVERGYRFFLLGGEPGLAERAASKALSEYPGLQIVGIHHGYCDFQDEHLLAEINAARPDILWVGMGNPRQTLWALAWQRQLQVGLVMTCGGMFKIVSGEMDRLPPKWRQCGFEWVYRLWQEPGTWRRYLVGLPFFGLRVLARCLSGVEHLPNPRGKRQPVHENLLF
jgi:N-acetylglucosaminyldiphosphoundecaprenol N-acetyl-beta-D-mannosaminyltransferase